MSIINIENQIPMVIENGYNTCYIDSLLVAMFYNKSNYVDFILDCVPKKPEGFYLQELIKLKFVEPLRKQYSISASTINEIRNYSIICGWTNDMDIDGQKDCSEFYTFFAEMFNVPNLEFEILEIKNNMLTENTQKCALPFIPLYPIENTNIKKLLEQWINTKINNNDLLSHCYKLSNIPQFVILNINRFNYNGTRNNHKVDIMKRIKFFGNNDSSQNYLKWKISGIVCHHGSNYKSGHYYSIVYNNKKWLMFDDMMVPSFEQIDFEDEDIRNKIMLEAVLVIYLLDA
jgi:ubiquitin C-terminal hydrolase